MLRFRPTVLLLLYAGTVPAESANPSQPRNDKRDQPRIEFVFPRVKRGGVVRCGLYNSRRTFLKRTVQGVKSAIKHGRAVCVFYKVKPGTYAAGAYHDANSNKKLDTNFIGIPNEGTAASNNARSFMGPPKWKDAKFVYRGKVLRQNLRFRY